MCTLPYVCSGTTLWKQLYYCCGNYKTCNNVIVVIVGSVTVFAVVIIWSLIANSVCVIVSSLYGHTTEPSFYSVRSFIIHEYCIKFSNYLSRKMDVRIDGSPFAGVINSTSRLANAFNAQVIHKQIRTSISIRLPEGQHALHFRQHLTMLLFWATQWNVFHSIKPLQTLEGRIIVASKDGAHNEFSKASRAKENALQQLPVIHPSCFKP